jgi:glycosyltransferase involved in cell wall biosynthesis
MTLISKPNLLYLSPVVPAVTGNGLAMRAGMFLEVLAQQYSIYLLVIPVYGSGQSLAKNMARHCCRVVVVPPRCRGGRRSQWIVRFSSRTGLASICARKPHVWQYASRAMIREAGRAFQTLPFDVVHVFRLYMTPFAQSYLNSLSHGRPKYHLDLDDIESTTHRRLAATYRLYGNTTMGRFEEMEARKYERIEQNLLPHCDCVYVCSAHDKEELTTRHKCRDIRVIPNAVRVPAPLVPKQPAVPFTFLFVGTLGYYPNVDALTYFCYDIVPLLRQRALTAFQLNIVGVGANPMVARLARVPEIRFIGAVPDVAPYYRAADAVVVPIRTGGGTRIKVLEAFSYSRPVVSTSVGIEGIAACAEEHVLVADSPAAFAEHCVRLMRTPALGEKLTRNAFALLTRAYTIEVVTRSVTAFA